MTMPNLNREIPWFFQHIENYYHLFVDIRFNNRDIIQKLIQFSLELEIQGFEGLIFTLYKPHPRRIMFDLRRHSFDQGHDFKNLNLVLTDEPMNSLDFVIIPFGYFKDEHKFRLSVRCNDIQTSFDIYSWAPSNLFKNVKSVIRIANRYLELIPLDDYKGYYYQVDASFKGNETGRLFDLTNHLVELDKTIDAVTKKSLFEPMDLEIKTLVSKSNQFLFELSQKSIPLDVKNVLRELERLKFNIDSLSKEEIFNWLDDLVAFYSRET
ncbi:MAG: hypothetical protein ACXAES_07000 [Promethearchaeota archaeon]|jgi:hypothetical protein